MTFIPEDLQRPLKRLRGLQVGSGLLEQLNGFRIVPDMPCEERLAASHEIISTCTWPHLQPIALPPPLQKLQLIDKLCIICGKLQGQIFSQGCKQHLTFSFLLKLSGDLLCTKIHLSIIR